MLLLRLLGLDPDSPEALAATKRVREGVTWGRRTTPFFGGETETCVNGMTLALGAYFGERGELVDQLLERLLGEQLDDGGWNWRAPALARASFNTTIVLEALLEYERSIAALRIAAARAGEEYLLERRLFRSRSTGEVIRSDWTRFSFPPQWHYDVLRGLEYFRSTGGRPTPAATRRSSSCGTVAATTAAGCSSTRTGRARTSRWRTATASRAGGTRSRRCACCAGPRVGRVGHRAGSRRHSIE